MRKGKTIVMAVSLILAAVIAGCSSNSNEPKEPAASNAAENSNSGGEASTNNEAAAPVELSVSLMGIQDGFDAQGAKEDKIFNDLQKKFNVTIKPVQVTWNDWQEKAKVWAASGQLPDIFPNAIAVENPALYASWAKQGVIKALPDDLSKYPNLARIMELPSIQPLKVDGKFYTVPRMTYNDSSDWILDRPILYRKDWAAQAGFTSEPQSFDEFVAMVKAVQKQHPGTVGIAIMNKDYLNTLFLPTFPEMSNKKSWTNENGKWVPSFASSKINDGIKQLRQLYTEGLLDKDFAIQKEADGFTKFMNGQAFISLGGTFTNPANVETFNKANPGVNIASVGLMNIWPAADGNRYTFVETPFWSETYFSNKLDDETFDRALQLIDYMSSEEYSALAVNGILDTDYKMEGDKAVSLLKGDETLQKKYPVNSAIGFLAQWNGAFGKAGKAVVNPNPDVAAWQAYDHDMFVKFKQEDKPAPINFDIMLMSTPAKDKLVVNVMDDLIKVILEKGDPVEMWNATVKGYDAKGLQEAIAEVNAKAAELGIK
ncbi:extracellular solute-binding protein [Paenibacillus prosopidis]|uniref:Putative aldouronate transport system substrate-binding protein n=1 Tax=Paenibacillus prosopidis TaxID=630520 RepID=A0A368W475_9BACL|nr:extracellular solute-binding protein [Paenibacillus prosopidis]RCW48368.1 putative aldouronate transport system substrate-binding protein [Paenibacillus prosopidis]